jgi:hypothetical protein
MFELRRILYFARETSPSVSVRRSINTLNHLFKGKDAFAQEKRLLLTNHVRDLDTIDYFSKVVTTYGNEVVKKESMLLQQRLREEQCCVVSALRAIKGSVLLV